MGRELKRVPMDFSWPLNKPYEGYINPLNTSKNCPYCDGMGYSPRAAFLTDQWYGKEAFKPEDNGSVPFEPDNAVIKALASRVDTVQYYLRHLNCSKEAAVDAESVRLKKLFNSRLMHHLNDADIDALVSAGRLMDLTHTWSESTGWTKRYPEVIPTAKQVNENYLSGFGHDSINSWVVIKAKCEAEGVSPTCTHCEGDGEIWPSKEDKDIYENWEPFEPPTGVGYQMWETVSEGSPITPVFATPEDLAAYLAINARGVDVNTTYEQWLKFIQGDGWACSMVMEGNTLMTGVESLAGKTPKYLDLPTPQYY